MRLIRRTRPEAVSRRVVVTLILVFGLLGAFGYATYLSYYGGLDLSNAFDYKTAVLSAQRDSELLEVEQFDRRSSPAALRPYIKLLASDLQRIATFAAAPNEAPPTFVLPTRREGYEVLSAKLAALSELDTQRFESSLQTNSHTRDLSSAFWVIVALLLAVLSSRLRATIEEGRSLVERLQRAFISKRRAIPNLDLGAVLISATEGSKVGGDVYDVFTFDNRSAMLFVGDVSGKGIDAAVDTALVKYSLRTLFTLGVEPGEMLQRFASIYEKSAEDPEAFIVLFLAIIDLTDGRVRYASAGHEPAWVLMNQGATRLEPTGPIVGVVSNATYATKTLYLRDDDTLVITTDGFTESRDSRGRLLGADGASGWLSEMGGDAQKIADRLVRRIRRRSRGIGDDLAILVVRFMPQRPSIRLRDASLFQRTRV
jgi:serine phosphatase RsbU (regulator of sigma subunit)